MSEKQKAPGHGSPPGTPRWVKLFVIIFIGLIVLVIVLHLMGFGFGSHGASGALPVDLIRYTLLMERSVQEL
jgi:hypothetical protein